MAESCDAATYNMLLEILHILHEGYDEILKTLQWTKPWNNATTVELEKLTIRVITYLKEHELWEELWKYENMVTPK